MAGNSPPRRSSRARTVQTQSQQSSAASSLSGRPERATRSLNKAASPQKSTPSLSDEPPEESGASTDEIPTRRRRTRAQEHEQERERAASNHTTVEMTGDHDDIQEDDEAVRCICGFDEYPGPPPMDQDKIPAKDSIDVDSNLTSDLNDDVAGFFVQCDICKIWQHGACVGIMSEEASPDEYFCEDCRKDLHRIHMASNGQRYSHYLPLVQDERKSTTRSRSPKGSDSKDGRETRSGRQSSLTQTSKRRSTMNSRDAAYDEEEQLRRAIEASKEETIHETTEGGHRRTKRGRSNSEEKTESLKRQRTKSESPSPLEQDNEPDADPEEAEEVNNSRNGVRRSRSGLTRTQSNQKEKSEREERERQRAEAAKKRNGRAERRRADGSAPTATVLTKGSDLQADTDSDPSEELPLAVRAAAHRTISDKVVTTTTLSTTTTIVETKIEAAPTSAPEQPPPSSQPSPDTPPSVAPAAPAAKPRRTKKKGRNQYTKDREAREETSPARSQSRDVQGHENGGPTTHHHGKAEGSSKAHSRTKGGFNSKVSMTDMRRKAHAMLDYITRTQVEMAGEITPPDDESRRPSKVVMSAGAELIETSLPVDKAPPSLSVTAPPSTTITNSTGNGSTNAPKDFKELTSMEMMDRLTRDLVKWQKEFAS